MKYFIIGICILAAMVIPACNTAQLYYQLDDSTVTPIVASMEAEWQSA